MEETKDNKVTRVLELYTKLMNGSVVNTRFEPINFSYNVFMPLKVNVTVLRRGVIGVGVVGYV